jgi:hypothetical protein
MCRGASESKWRVNDGDSAKQWMLHLANHTARNRLWMTNRSSPYRAPVRRECATSASASKAAGGIGE